MLVLTVSNSGDHMISYVLGAEIVNDVLVLGQF